MRVLADICEFIVDCEHKTAPVQGEGYPSIRTPNIGPGYLILDGVNRVSQATYEAWTRRAEPQGGDLILAREAPVGNVAVVPEGLKCCLGQRTVLIRPKPSDVDSDYLCYLLLTPAVQADLLGKSGGATVHHLNLKDIRALPISELPSLSQQRKLAGHIKAYDDLIENNRRRIALLEESARLLYREWFVDMRFPAGGPTNQGTGLPNGWRHAPLEEALFLQRGFDLPSGSRVPDGVPVYASSGVVGFHNQAMATGPGIVTGRSGTLGAVQFVDEDFWPLNTSLWVKEFRAATPTFAYFLLLEMNLAQFNSGSTVPTLDRKVVHSQPVVIPTAEAMADFEVCVSQVFKQITTLKKSIALTTEARNALLPKLMSGEIAV